MPKLRWDGAWTFRQGHGSRAVSRHPAPKAWVVRIALNANISWWRNRRREVVAYPVLTGQGRQGRCEMDPGPGGTLSWSSAVRNRVWVSCVRLLLRRALEGGIGARAWRRISRECGRPWPHAGLARRPGADGRRAEGRVRARAAY